MEKLFDKSRGFSRICHIDISNIRLRDRLTNRSGVTYHGGVGPPEILKLSLTNPLIQSRQDGFLPKTC